MGIFDKAKDLIGEHGEQVAQGIDQAAEMVDDKTGGQYSEQIDQGAEQVKGAVENLGGQSGE